MEKTNTVPVTKMACRKGNASCMESDVFHKKIRKQHKDSVEFCAHSKKHSLWVQRGEE